MDGTVPRSRLWKLVPAVSLGTVVILLVAAVGIALYYEHSYKSQNMKETLVQADVLASTVTAALVFDDRKTAQEYVNALQANPEIRAVGVYNVRGELIASYRRGNAAVPSVAPPHGGDFDGDLLSVSTPVMQLGAPVGTVYLNAVTEPLADRLTRYGAIGLVVAMAALVVGVLGVAHSLLGNTNKRLAELNADLQAQIAEREKAEEALRHSQKMEALGQLSGGIAHDFNNFLTIIRSNLYLLEKRLRAGNTDVSRFITMAQEGVHRASNVTQRILAFSRRQALTPKPVDLSHLIEELAPLLKNSVGEAITLDTRLNADWWISCDQNQMESVVLNLVVNGRDAMPSGGRLVIKTENVQLSSPNIPTEAHGDYVKLSVTDSGIGMSDEVRQRAIDPFFTTKPEGRGTGLGLSMIYGYITQSQGYLEIDSRIGEGTTITILMPRLHDVPTDVATDMILAQSGLGAAQPLAHPTILVVEDDELVRTLAVECLREHAFVVLENGDGDDALNVVKSDQHIDLLITDIRLPGIDGCRLAASALAERPTLKVILVTGYHQEPIPDELTGAGVKVFYKPYNLEDLVDCANGLLKLYRPTS